MGIRPLGPLEQELADGRRKYRNWGRWGQDDIRGTLNYIDDHARAAAAALVTKGTSIPLALELNHEGPSGKGGPTHTMLTSGLDAAKGIQGFAHGYGRAGGALHLALRTGTRWDGLGNVFDHKQAWNGRPCDEVVTGAGDGVTGVERVAGEFVGRGVLLDVGRALGRDGELPDGFAITEEHLETAIALQGPTSGVGRGDIVLIRTGQLARCRGRGAWDGYRQGPAPGLSFTTLDWLHRTEIAAAATDTWDFEVRPYEFAEEACSSPLHQIAVPNMGLVIGVMFNLEHLAADCLADGVYEFLLVAAPLPITGAVHAPVNPIALK